MRWARDCSRRSTAIWSPRVSVFRREHHSRRPHRRRIKEPTPRCKTKKGNEWHFGMKVHIGVDSQTGVVHSMTTNVDLTELPRLRTVGSPGVGRCWVSDPGNRGLDVEWQVMRPGPARKLEYWLRIRLRRCRRSAKRRSAPKVEHPIPVHQAALRLRQGPLQGTVQEHAAAEDADWGLPT